MFNRQSFLFEKDAAITGNKLVPQYAKNVCIKKDIKGYWLNVDWRCGVAAPLTFQEFYQLNQAKGV